ncbi:hypothetical protein DXG01_006521 [Tephrocybe rancida]|nr:hypothetical protein DXG01_006521 [Tephrocybe rancida]
MLSAPLRICAGNPAFASLPWFTDQLLEAEDLRDLVPKDSPVFTLVSSLLSAEDRGLPPAPGDEYSVFAATMLSLPVPFYNDKQVKEARFKTLLSYRVIDVYLHSSGAPLPRSSCLHPVTAHKKLPPPILNDVPMLISSACAGILSYLANTAPCPPSGTSSAITPSFSTTDLAVIADVPAAFDGVASRGKALLKMFAPASATDDLAAAIADFTRGSRLRPHYMQKALACALSSSSLVLFSVRNLHDGLRKDALCAQWTSVGAAERPTHFSTVENTVWGALFSAASGGDLLPDILAALDNVEDAVAARRIAIAAPSSRSDQEPPPAQKDSSSNYDGNTVPEPTLKPNSKPPTTKPNPKPPNLKPPKPKPKPKAKDDRSDQPPLPPKKKPATEPEVVTLKATVSHNYFNVYQVVNLTNEESDVEDNKPENTRLEITAKEPMLELDRLYTVFNLSSGAPETLAPKFHRQFRRDHEWFSSMVNAAEARHINGLPRYLSPDAAVRATSAVEVLTAEEYSCLSSSKVLEKLQTKNLVVTGGTPPKRKFDKDMLRLLGSLEATITIHDLSIDPTPEDDRMHKGTSLDLLRTRCSPRPKALSGLNFPLSYDPFPPQNFLSDTFAWSEAQGRGFCKSHKSYPVSEMRWGLGSTAGTYHYFHLDANGYGTFMEVDHGSKLWFFSTPKVNQPIDSGSIDLFTGVYERDEPNVDLLDVELVYLAPGDKLCALPTVL